MVYSIYKVSIDNSVCLKLFEIAWHTIEIRLDCIINYDYREHHFILICNRPFSEIEEELSDIYIIKNIEKITGE